jgi:hypothetical protein
MTRRRPTIKATGTYSNISGGYTRLMTPVVDRNGQLGAFRMHLELT